MSTPVSHAPLPSLMQRLAEMFSPLHARGRLLDGPARSPRVGTTRTVAECAPNLPLFIARLRELLAATDESVRSRLEREVLDLAVPLQAAGLFEVLRIAHAPLAAMVADHLATSGSHAASLR